MLKTETNKPSIDRLVRHVWANSLLGGEHGRISTDFEHGQWWVTCLACGAQFSVNDAEPGTFDFEEVTRGDEESCAQY